MKKLYILVIVSIALSCNKDKYFSKKLIKGETWKLENVTVDGTSINSGTTWEVKGDDIYETVSQVTWSQNSINSSNFEWQFHDKGKSWVLNYLQDTAECQGAFLDDLDYLADDLTGTYEVITHKKKEMFFRSSSTKKYPNQVVEIKVVRK